MFDPSAVQLCFVVYFSGGLHTFKGKGKKVQFANPAQTVLVQQSSRSEGSGRSFSNLNSHARPACKKTKPNLVCPTYRCARCQLSRSQQPSFLPSSLACRRELSIYNLPDPLSYGEGMKGILYTYQYLSLSSSWFWGLVGWLIGDLSH